APNPGCRPFSVCNRPTSSLAAGVCFPRGQLLLFNGKQSMYCPKCLAEYEEGFTECADCQVALVSGHAPQPTKEPEVELVTVLETGEPIALSLAKASLDEAGITHILTPQEPSPFRPQHFWSFRPSVAIPRRIEGAPEDEKEARRLLEPLRTPVPAFNGT